MTKGFDNDNNAFIELQKRIDNIDEQLITISKKLDGLNNKSHKREKNDPKRIKKYISFDPEQYGWIESNIESWKFASFAHAIEWGLFVLKEKLEKE